MVDAVKTTLTRTDQAKATPIIDSILRTRANSSNSPFATPCSMMYMYNASDHRVSEMLALTSDFNYRSFDPFNPPSCTSRR